MPSAVVGAESLAPAELETELCGLERNLSRDHTGKTVSSFSIRPVSKWVLLVVALGMFATGSFDSVVSKWMNKQKLPQYDGGKPEFFEAPWFQTFVMYLGEWLIMAVYYFDVLLRKKKGKKSRFDFPSSAKSFRKPHCPVYWWLIPCCFDFISSTMINYAIVYAAPSTVQMLRNFNVVITAILTCIYLRVALRVHQVYGVLLITVGLVLTGLTATLHPDRGNNYGHSTAALGILMSIAGTAISAFQFVFEERLLRKYQCSPFEAVGWMGLYGSIIGAICLGIGQAAGFENSRVTFYQMGLGTKESQILIGTNIGFILAISIFNACGLSVTKLASGLLRTVVQTARTISVWLISLIIGWEKFEGLQFAGLMIIAAAVFTYNYNYLGFPSANSVDRHLRKPLVCCCLEDPDTHPKPAEVTANSEPGSVNEVPV